MKNISISITEQHAAEIEGVIATGDYASVSEVLRAALREFLDRRPEPPLDQIERDIARYREEQAAGQTLLGRDAAERHVLASIGE